MRYQTVFYHLSILTIAAGAMLLPSVGIAWLYKEFWPLKYFLMTAAAAMAIGGIFALLSSRFRNEPIGIRDGFLLVTGAWIITPLIGAVPFFVSGHFPTFIDAAFESISGFTTTGASVLSNVEILPASLLFWRNFTHWIGGMGIIVLAVAILPQLSIGGMQIMKNETPGPQLEQLKPRIRQTAMSLWKVYVVLSVLHVLVLWALGMPLFESICHMFGSIATGGFSVKNASIGAYSGFIQMATTLFMFLGGTNFVLHYAWLRQGDFKKMFRDGEWRFYASLLFACFLVISMDLVYHHKEAILDAFRLSVFQVVSVATATGYATADFDQWPNLSKGILFLLMFVGGCAGSTSGGIKQVRLLLLFKMLFQSIQQHIHRRAIISVKLNRRPVPESILQGVGSFFLLWMLIFCAAMMVLLAYNIDFVSAASGVIACMSTIGPGLGIVGPAQNYGHLPEVVKVVLLVCMIVGRLEIFTVLVLFVPQTWRR